MGYMIKELRHFTGMTQKSFAEWFDIPVSTLRKWEQGEASPAPYVIKLIARSIPEINTSLEKIETNNHSIFYYDPVKKMIFDQKGNGIIIKESLDGVKKQNLKLYVQDLFESFYAIQDKFNRDCYYDKEEDILWV